MPNNLMCDVCDGSGQELDAGGWPVDCHLCEGTGFLDWDDDDGAHRDAIDDEVTRQIMVTPDADAIAGRWPPLVKSAATDKAD